MKDFKTIVYVEKVPGFRKSKIDWVCTFYINK